MMAVAMWMAVELAVAITLMFAMAMVMVIKKGMAPTMAIFSLNAQCTGGRVSGGAGRRARWAGCLEH